MTAPALAVVPAADPGLVAPRAAAADDGAFAGLLADATPSDGARPTGVLPAEELEVPEDEQTGIADGAAVLAAQAQVLVLPQQLPVDLVVTGSSPAARAVGAVDGAGAPAGRPDQASSAAGPAGPRTAAPGPTGVVAAGTPAVGEATTAGPQRDAGSAPTPAAAAAPVTPPAPPTPAAAAMPATAPTTAPTPAPAADGSDPVAAVPTASGTDAAPTPLMVPASAAEASLEPTDTTPTATPTTSTDEARAAAAPSVPGTGAGSAGTTSPLPPGSRPADLVHAAPPAPLEAAPPAPSTLGAADLPAALPAGAAGLSVSSGSVVLQPATVAPVAPASPTAASPSDTVVTTAPPAAPQQPLADGTVTPGPGTAPASTATPPDVAPQEDLREDEPVALPRADAPLGLPPLPAQPVGPAPVDTAVAGVSERRAAPVGLEARLPEPDAVRPSEPLVAPGQAAPAFAPADTALARLAAERAPEQVRPAVAELARGLRDVGGGRASLVVRLDPPELGPVVVRLTVRDGRVDVQLRTGEAAASVGLAAASADVRSTLQQHGLDLSSFDVQHGDAQDAPAGGRASSDQATPDRRGSADRSASTSRARVVRDTDPDPATGGTAGAWL